MKFDEHQLKAILTLTAGVKNVTPFVTGCDQLETARLAGLFPAIPGFVTDVSRPEQWKAYLIAVYEHALDLLRS